MLNQIRRIAASAFRVCEADLEPGFLKLLPFVEFPGIVNQRPQIRRLRNRCDRIARAASRKMVRHGASLGLSLTDRNDALSGQLFKARDVRSKAARASNSVKV
jgi:hypothetical protein